jgi:molecular chaperone GrpE
MSGKEENQETQDARAEGGETVPAPADAKFSAENDLREQLLRLKAEFDNVKKRLERDKQDSIRFANEKILADMLKVVDTFDHATASLSEGHDPAKVAKGLRIASEELHKILERHGVQPIKSVGEPFDPNMHEAVAEVEESGKKAGTVVDEVQRGYVLNGRLIRPSRVRVAKAKE